MKLQEIENGCSYAFYKTSILNNAQDVINAIADKIRNLKTSNIIAAGKTGVGKSTLINAIFREKLAETGMGKPVTDHMRKLTKKDIPLAIYDTHGFEIIQNGGIIFETSRGYSNIEFSIKNTMETRFTVASVAKQFTAFAIMILYDKGLLRLDEKANRYLPSNMQLPSEITVHHLLSHTSGLHNNYNFEDDFYVGEDRKPYHKEQFFRNWIIREPIKKPGEDFDYNNSNYNL